MIALRIAASTTAVLLFAAAPASANTVTLDCAADAVFGAPSMKMVYEGDDSGTLIVTGGFGEMRLPATFLRHEGTDENGAKLTATGIRASGAASVLMPDKAALEVCATGKLSKDQLADSDIVYATLMGCVPGVPVGGAPVVVNAHAEIAIEPNLNVSLSRIYAEPTDLSVDKIAVAAFPKCALAK